ncbi:hypothetical protein BDA96_01G114300 [Sorghum bicolor]|uniref:Uncharacterized protein n=2 Tax=Sorghum bicolor TaxID=4558 RepID=A0A921RY12_SORBI|nr:hypothetical protein BDA96_01G114300 [Sorghum bicolor]OQU91082.1 hypothetical protein SORBI_3001G110150 [Sorghum bicolor]
MAAEAEPIGPASRWSWSRSRRRVSESIVQLRGQLKSWTPAGMSPPRPPGPLRPILICLTFFSEQERSDARGRERSEVSICSLTSFRGWGKDSPIHVPLQSFQPRNQDPGYKMAGKPHVTTFEISLLFLSNFYIL